MSYLHEICICILNSNSFCKRNTGSWLGFNRIKILRYSLELDTMKYPYCWSKHTDWSKIDRISIEQTHQCIIWYLSEEVQSHITKMDILFIVYYHLLNFSCALLDIRDGTYGHMPEFPNPSSIFTSNIFGIKDQISIFTTFT
jgi:hypothetical protein